MAQRFWHTAISQWTGGIAIPAPNGLATQSRNLENNQQALGPSSGAFDEPLIQRLYGDINIQVATTTDGTLAGAVGIIVIPVGEGISLPTLDTIADGELDWLYWRPFALNTLDLSKQGSGIDYQRLMVDAKSKRRLKQGYIMAIYLTATSSSPTPPAYRWQFGLRWLLQT